MAKQGISAPSVLINNDTIAIVPNSLKYDAGEGEIKVRSSSTGGGGSESIHTIDAEGKYSMVKFDVFTTAGLDSQIATWKARIGTNSVKFTQQIGLEFVSRSFTGLSLATKIERDAGADGVTSLEFHGDQMSAA